MSSDVGCTRHPTYAGPVRRRCLSCISPRISQPCLTVVPHLAASSGGLAARSVGSPRQPTVWDTLQVGNVQAQAAASVRMGEQRARFSYIRGPICRPGGPVLASHSCRPHKSRLCWAGSVHVMAMREQQPGRPLIRRHPAHSYHHLLQAGWVPCKVAGRERSSLPCYHHHLLLLPIFPSFGSFSGARAGRVRGYVSLSSPRQVLALTLTSGRFLLRLWAWGACLLMTWVPAGSAL